MSTAQIGANKPPSTYRGRIEEHLSQIVAYLTAAGDRANATAPKDGSEATQKIALSSSDVAITEDTHNLESPSYSIVRLDADAAWNLTGIVADPGRLLLLFNVGSFNVVLQDQDANSDAENRFELGVDRTLTPNASEWLWYDETDARWRRAATV
jgi:hypothetical protein